MLRYYFHMFGYAEYHIVSSALTGAFCGATIAAIFGAKRLLPMLLSAAALALLECASLLFGTFAEGIALAAIALAVAATATKSSLRSAISASVVYLTAVTLCDAILRSLRCAGPLCLLVSVFAYPLVFAVICAVRKRLITRKTMRSYGASVTLTVGERSVSVPGFWDSGNTLRYRGYMPVIVLDDRVSEILENARIAGAISVSSACGSRVKVAYFLDRVTVSDSDGIKTFGDVVAVSSDARFDGFDVLLNCGLC